MCKLKYEIKLNFIVMTTLNGRNYIVFIVDKKIKKKPMKNKPTS